MSNATRNPPSTSRANAELTPHQSRLIEQDNARLRSELAFQREQVRQLRLQLEQAHASHCQALRQYATTRQFHQSSDLEKRVVRIENAYQVQQGRINTLDNKLDAIRGVL